MLNEVLYTGFSMANGDVDSLNIKISIIVSYL